ncbi:unnamed protein product [Closterium sp. Naga37s-1]|nr:unnamed protein product [Closterium sp. Naga37s-1]
MSGSASASSLAPPLSLSLQPPSPAIINSFPFALANPPSPRSSLLVPSLRSHAPASASVPFALSPPPLGSTPLASIPAFNPPYPCQCCRHCQSRQQQQQQQAAPTTSGTGYILQADPPVTCVSKNQNGTSLNNAARANVSHAPAVPPAFPAEASAGAPGGPSSAAAASGTRAHGANSSAVVSIEGSVWKLKPSDAIQFQQQLLGSETQVHPQQQSTQSRQPMARQLQQLPLPTSLPEKHQAKGSMQRAPLHRLRLEQGNQQKENWRQDVVGGAAGAAILGGEPYPAPPPPLIPLPTLPQAHATSGPNVLLGGSFDVTRPLPKLMPLLLSAIANASATPIPAELPKSSLIPVSGSAAKEAFAVEYTSAEGSSAGHASAGSMSAPIGAPSLAPPLPLSLQPPSPTIISSAFVPATPSSPRSSPLIPSARSNTPASASVPLALSPPPLGSTPLAPLPASTRPNPCQCCCHFQPKQQQQQQAAVTHDTCYPLQGEAPLTYMNGTNLNSCMLSSNAPRASGSHAPLIPPTLPPTAPAGIPGSTLLSLKAATQSTRHHPVPLPSLPTTSPSCFSARVSMNAAGAVVPCTADGAPSAAAASSAARPEENKSSAVVSIEGSVWRHKQSGATQFQQQLLGFQTQEEQLQQQSRQSRQPVARQLQQLPLPSSLSRKHQAQGSTQREPFHRLLLERGNQQKENWQQDVVGGAAGAAILGGEPYPAAIPPLLPCPTLPQGHNPSVPPAFLGKSNSNYRTGPLPKLMPFILSAIANGKASAPAASLAQCSAVP